MARGAESQQQYLSAQHQRADSSGKSGPLPASAAVATPAVANPSSSSPNTSPATAGPQYLKLRALGITDIPAHARLKDAQSNPKSVSSFLRQVFTEAKDSTVEGFTRIGSKCDHVREPDAWTWFKVEKLKHQYPGEHDTWFARRSWHDEDETKVEGHVVGFEELDGVLRKNHSFNELCYTPNVYDSNDVLVWDKGELVDVAPKLEREVGIRDVEMRITQMYHAMPWPVQNRVFTFLLISGIRSDLPNPNIKSHARPPSESDTPSKEPQLITPTAQFVVLQIPVDLSTFPTFIQQARHDHSPDGSHLVYRAPSGGPAGALSKEQQKHAGRKLIEGTYVSVEKVTRMEKADGKFTTEWIMKTASDAKGALPGWMQNLGVPGQIAQDVGWVLAYIVRGRGKDEKKEKRNSG